MMARLALTLDREITQPMCSFSQSDFILGLSDMKRSQGAAAVAARARGERLLHASLLLIGILLSVMVAAAPAFPASATATAAQASPEQVVTTFHAALLRAMKDGANDYQRRYQTLDPAMSNTFDFVGMTRIAVGPRWATVAPEQQAALVDAFRRFSVANYASQFDSYSGESFEISGPTESEPQGAIVSTVMQLAQGKPVKFNYLLHRTASGWRIVDIYLDGTISQLAVRRSEFSSVLADSGPDGLAQMLDQKAKKLAVM